MPPDAILVLAGTAEAKALAHAIAAEWPSARLIVSLAGRTKAPLLSPGTLRIGGFGGAEGLAAFLRTERIGHLVDATHPFAAGMSRNAAEAAHATGTPRIALVRPAWERVAGDRWISVSCLGAARDALPDGARPFLALGRQHIAPFRHRPDLVPVLRMVDPPEEPLPFAAEVVLGRPPADPDAEAALFSRLGITHLVCRNSGGEASRAKIMAARRLSLPVVMIERPPPPPGPSARTIEAVMTFLGETPPGPLIRIPADEIGTSASPSC